MLDTETGEVLAMANQPTYNPNDRSQFVAERYRNRAITDIFEPGSSIKPLIVTAALESGEYRASSVIDTAPGFVTVGAKTIEDKRNLGRISLTTILARSSNVGATKVAMSLKPRELWGHDAELRAGYRDQQRFSWRIGWHADASRSLETDQPGNAGVRLRPLGYTAATRAGLRHHRQRR